ncbi:MAG: hypothetical protein CFK52_03450 [Chloracidobacterium sp. CP2_5A]|nr:MAG: hypothetical protein CFK52_03450 [Chloracidobacterium sp. CP2_5A]
MMRRIRRATRQVRRYTFQGRNVTRRRTLFCLGWLMALLVAGQAQSSERFSVAVLPPRLADEAGGVSAEMVLTPLEAAFARAGLTVLPRAQVVSALPAGDQLNFNPTRAEARALGARVGSEGYALAALQRGERSATDRRTVIGGTLRLFAVETRSGQLIASERADFTEDQRGFLAAVAPLMEATATRLSAQWRAARERLTAAAGQGDACPEALDLRAGDLPPQTTPPAPLTRPRPEPTEDARAAGVAVTISAEVCVTADGGVSGVEIVRWAGYGLEAAVVAALRATRFKPATQNGKPVPARFLADFNFRAPPASSSGAESPKARRPMPPARRRLQEAGREWRGRPAAPRLHPQRPASQAHTRCRYTPGRCRTAKPSPTPDRRPAQC